MRDIKTYLSVAPVVSTLWFGALVGYLIGINRLFPDALSFFFLILVIAMLGIEFFVTCQNRPFSTILAHTMHYRCMIITLQPGYPIPLLDIEKTKREINEKKA
jgi:photosystem I subunit 9